MRADEEARLFRSSGELFRKSRVWARSWAAGASRQLRAMRVRATNLNGMAATVCAVLESVVLGHLGKHIRPSLQNTIGTLCCFLSSLPPPARTRTFVVMDCDVGHEALAHTWGPQVCDVDRGRALGVWGWGRCNGRCRAAGGLIRLSLQEQPTPRHHAHPLRCSAVLAWGALGALGAVRGGRPPPAPQPWRPGLRFQPVLP